ncbi:conserved hypothetical protein [Trichinella spiralis]|uniref:hypothetical protein n=1 Tax=Trichinella spiralis TaxID=6334 RepID=UPI0001EFDFA3|nr:conserved hypothetical protein [Trichinella spiralis]
MKKTSLTGSRGKEVDHFVELTRESEAWHKIIGRLLVRKQEQKVLIKLMIAGLAVPQLQCCHAVRQTVAVRNQGNRLDLTGEDDKIFSLYLLMAFNFTLN